MEDSPQPRKQQLRELVELDLKIHKEKKMAKDTITTFEFLIENVQGQCPMKNILLLTLSVFKGTTNKDPYTFLFEFDFLCRSYDYTLGAQKLKLFPASLKGVALRWFMGLGVSSISSWEDMKKTFLEKYQGYCRSRDQRE